MIKYIILMLSLLLMGCFGEKTSNTSTVTQSITDSKHHRDISYFNRPLPLHKDESDGVRLVMKHPEYSINKSDTVKYEIYNIDNYRVDTGESELEFWEDNKWNDVLFDRSVAQISYIIWKDNHRSFKFNLSNIESSFLKKGKFRIIKIVKVVNQDETVEKRISLFAEFILVE